MKRFLTSSWIALICFSHILAMAAPPDVPVAGTGTQAIALDATYASSTVDRTITFKPNGMAFESSVIAKFPEFSYRIEGNSIKAESRAYQLKIMPDGSIDGGAAYGKMTKK